MSSLDGISNPVKMKPSVNFLDAGSASHHGNASKYPLLTRAKNKRGYSEALHAVLRADLPDSLKGAQRLCARETGR